MLEHHRYSSLYRLEFYVILVGFLMRVSTTASDSGEKK